MNLDFPLEKADKISSKSAALPGAATREVRVGPAGWSYTDWAGYVYPTRRAKGFHEATYLAEFFDTIEINTSFYGPMRADHAKLWVERVSANPRFLFTAKLWQKFTHDPVSTREDERAVREGFDVLRGAGKLGAVLAQFPFSFHRSGENMVGLTVLLQRFADYPLAVELRQMLGCDRLPTRDDPGILHRVGQFPHIPFEVVAVHDTQCFGCNQVGHRLDRPLGSAGQQVPGQVRDVLFAVAQGWKMNVKHV